MPRPIHALIHTAALRHNLQRCRQAAGGARVWAVVKANAYGHGMARVYEALQGADGFALLDLHEAQLLRDLGWRGPILLLEGVFEPRDLELCSRLNIWHAVHSDEQLAMLAAHKTLQPHTVFLKINTGMNRLGFAPHRARAVWTRLQAMPQVEDIGWMTHFATADVAEPGLHSAWQSFIHTTAELPGLRSACNSAALLRHPQIAAQTDWVRPGIALYGSSPDAPEHDIAHWNLQPTMTLASKIIATQALLAGDSVGYGSHFVANQETELAIVSIGYGDGYPRAFPKQNYVAINGQAVAVVGRVAMDMIAIDVTGLNAGLGTKVELWGENRLVDDVAEANGTIGYELLCRLSNRPIRKQI